MTTTKIPADQLASQHINMAALQDALEAVAPGAVVQLRYDGNGQPETVEIETPEKADIEAAISAVVSVQTPIGESDKAKEAARLVADRDYLGDKIIARLKALEARVASLEGK